MVIIEGLNQMNEADQDRMMFAAAIEAKIHKRTDAEHRLNVIATVFERCTALLLDEGMEPDGVRRWLERSLVDGPDFVIGPMKRAELLKAEVELWPVIN